MTNPIYYTKPTWQAHSVNAIRRLNSLSMLWRGRWSVIAMHVHTQSYRTRSSHNLVAAMLAEHRRRSMRTARRSSGS